MGKPKREWVVGVVFLKQILLIFGGPLQLLLLRYTAEYLQVTWVILKCYSVSARAKKIFQKRTVFVFTKSWSRDQLMQKAYSPFSHLP